MNLTKFTETESTMSSKEIADLTGKQHKHVLRDIKDQILGGLYDYDIYGPNLGYPSIQGLTVKYDEHTKRISEILMDREHTITLVTGYDVKSRHAINKRWMELETKQQKPMTTMEMVIASAQHIQKLEHDIKVLQAKQEATDCNYGFYSVLAFAKLKGRKISPVEAARLGKSATAMSKKYGISTGSVPDARYGTVGTYDEEILEELFGENHED